MPAAAEADLLVVLPLALPLLACALGAVLWRFPKAQRGLTLAAAFALLVAAVALLAHVAARGGPVASQMGGWPAPFGITLVADLLSAALVAAAALVYAAVAVYGCADGPTEREEQLYHPLLSGLMLGVCGAFLAGDVFNLYVWFEVMLIASFGLLAVGGGRAQLDAGVKYLALNMVATTVLLFAVALLYGMTGTLNMADLARRVPEVENRGAVAAVALLFLGAFGMKAAAFPLFYWLPASYHTATPQVGAVFAALLTKVGVYGVFRLFTLVFAGTADWMPWVLGAVAVATMITGTLGAVAHWDVRRILAFNVIGSVGVMLVGAAVATPLAIAGAVFYVLQDVLVKANLFLVAGAIRRAGGSYALARLGGLWRREPLLGLLFLLPALSLAGLPPLAGFWGKVLLVRSGLEAEAYVIAVAVLVAGLVALYSMLRIWTEAFWKEAPEEAPLAPHRMGAAERWLMLGPAAALALLTLSLGLWAEPLLAFALAAGEQLTAGREAYLNAVLGGAAAP
jgi:multicomponent Na+:H+ antiporter subunit D